MNNSTYSKTTKPLYYGTQIVWYTLGIIELLLFFRLALKLLGANVEAGFTSFIYGITHIFVVPFMSVFSISEAQGSILEWTTILAMIVYWVIAIGIIKLFFMGQDVSPHEASRRMNEQEVL